MGEKRFRYQYSNYYPFTFNFTFTFTSNSTSTSTVEIVFTTRTYINLDQLDTLNKILFLHYHCDFSLMNYNLI